MSRTIYTERDIEDLAKRGIRELEVDENVYITDIAREKMEVLGIKTKTAAPRPVSSLPAHMPAVAAPRGSLTESERQEVIEKVKSGVIARLGAGVDAAVLDAIVRRVVGQL